MNQSPPVRGLERRRDLGGDGLRLIERERAFGRDSLDILHHEVVRTHIVQCADVGMVQRCNGPGLAVESLAEASVGDLDGDHTVQPGVAGLVHVAHPAPADGGEDFEMVETVAGSQTHQGRRLYRLPGTTFWDYFFVILKSPLRVSWFQLPLMVLPSTLPSIT